MFFVWSFAREAQNTAYGQWQVTNDVTGRQTNDGKARQVSIDHAPPSTCGETSERRTVRVVCGESTALHAQRASSWREVEPPTTNASKLPSFRVPASRGRKMALLWEEERSAASPDFQEA